MFAGYFSFRLEVNLGFVVEIFFVISMVLIDFLVLFFRLNEYLFCVYVIGRYKSGVDLDFFLREFIV